MADTIRSIQELNALLADNDNQGISPQDIRDMMVSMMVHGEIGSMAKPAITLGTGFQPLDLDGAGAIGRGLTIDTVNKWISGIPVDMKALINLEVMFKGSNGATYDFAVFLNPATNPVQIERLSCSQRILSTQHIATFSMSASLQLAAGDVIQAGVRGSGFSFELLRCGLRVQRIGVE